VYRSEYLEKFVASDANTEYWYDDNTQIEKNIPADLRICMDFLTFINKNSMIRVTVL
jgi:hypothetical protein